MDTNQIYKIVNTVNRKVYIGFTGRGLKARLASHKTYAKQKPYWPLYAAMLEYGMDKFAIELIEDIPSLSEDIYRREQYWINYYDSAYPNGYNADGESLKRLRGISKFLP